TLKYSTKPADMVADPEWFLELTRQTHKRRFVATGGA
ncbi:protein rep, partial [Escherichia coli]